MAKISSVNNTPLTGAAAMYIWKTTAVAAGWVVKSSSDGTTYNSTGDQISHGGSGANGMLNSRAWFRIQDPGTRREIVVQISTSGSLNWRVKYSPLAKFTGGSPAATVTPDATDEVFLKGSGTSASPTFAALFTTDNTYKWHCIFQNAAEGNVYGFWCFATTNGSGASAGGMCCEPMGTTTSSASDQDPCVFGFSSSVSLFTVAFGIALLGSLWSAFYKFNLSGAAFVTHSGYSYNTSSGIGGPNSFGNNPYDGNENGVSIQWGRDAFHGSSTGSKGFGKYIRWVNSTRGYPDTINLASDAYVCVDDVFLPWENGTTPLV